MNPLVTKAAAKPSRFRPFALAISLASAGLILISAALSGCAKEPAPAGAQTAASGHVLRLSQRNEPGNLDPATATLPDEFAVLRALSEGLLIPGPNGSAPRPGAAESFTISPDGLTYTFRLRPARWSNGEAVTAQHFVDAYQRALTPATAAPKASVFYPVKNARAFVSGELSDFSAVGIQALDAQTLRLTLEQPTPRFPYYVASGPWLPVHVPTVVKHGRKWTEPGNFIGNGPFVLTEWRPQQRLVMRKNPHWYGAAGVKLAEIQFIRFDSGDAEERAFRTGQVDVTMAVPENKVPVYAREQPDALHRASMIETRYLSFNTQRAPLTDPRVRRALALAINAPRIAARVTRGGQHAATRLLPPALRASPASTPLEHEFRYDPDAARKLLAEAGLTGATFPKLELSAWSNTPVLEAVQAMWKQELGIDVAIVVRDARVHLSSLAQGDYDIGFITAIPDVADPANLLADFITGAPENYPQWSDAAFDRAYTHAMSLAAEPARSNGLERAENRLLEAAPVAPLYFNTKVWLMSPRVRGWMEDGLWSRTYHEIYLSDE